MWSLSSVVNVESELCKSSVRRKVAAFSSKRFAGESDMLFLYSIHHHCLYNGYYYKDKPREIILFY